MQFRNNDNITEATAIEEIKSFEDSEHSDKYENLADDEHILHLWEPLKFEIDEDFKFVNDNPIFLLFSDLLYIIVFPILWIFNKLTTNFKVYGRKNLTKVKGGKITVSNHVHVMDCTMTGTVIFPHKTYFLSLKSNFNIPVVNIIIRLLNAIPIPDDLENKKRFYSSIDKLLQEGKTLHIYPEGALWPYYTGLRNFKNGAFKFAVDNNVPIVPMVYTFTEPTGIRKLVRKKPFVNLHILEPIYPDFNISKDIAIHKLKEDVFQAMQAELDKHYHGTEKHTN